MSEKALFRLLMFVEEQADLSESASHARALLRSAASARPAGALPDRRTASRSQRPIPKGNDLKLSLQFAIISQLLLG